MSDQAPIQQQAQSSEKISFEEFLTRYDGKHAEWLMGEVDVLVSNNRVHQMILLFLSSLLNYYLGVAKIGQLMLAGFPMYVGDDHPAREPDLMIILQENLGKIKETYLEGAADIVIEIVSPESSYRDRGIKLDEFEAAGVKEYWLIDPLRKQAVFYALADDGRYNVVEPDSQKRLVSPLLPKFALNPALLWQEELPTGNEIPALLREMAVIE